MISMFGPTGQGARWGGVGVSLYRVPGGPPRKPYTPPRVERRFAWPRVFRANPMKVFVDCQRHGFQHGSTTSWTELARWMIDRDDAIRSDVAGDVYADHGVWLRDSKRCGPLGLD